MSLVTEHLEGRGIRFEVLPHPRTESALQEAAALGVSASEVIKTLVLDVGTGHALAVIPAYRKLDLDLAALALGERHVGLASEDEMARDLPEFDLGTTPPIASLVHLPTIIDPEVFDHAKVVFAAGSHRESVRTSPEPLFTHGATVTVAPITRPVRVEEQPEGKQLFPG